MDSIATGGMAEIFKAKTFAHGGFESLFVIKRILPDLGEDPEFVEMFVDEAKVSVVLQHPNIVRVFDFGKEGRNFFIAMEHVGGRDVRRIMHAAAKARQPMPPRFAAHIAAEACRGLHHAHTRTGSDGNSLGIIHRDMSPANILVSYDGEVKVADFGIAKAEDKIASTDVGVLKGKYEYMSPEQADGAVVDPRSDVFSLGVVLYEMLSGHRAFRSEDDDETLRRIRELELAPLEDVAPMVPRALLAVVDKALRVSPAERFASAREMADALRRALDPLTTEELHEELGAWMKGIFAGEVELEAARLELGTARARQMWEESPRGATVAPASSGQSRLVGTLMVALLALLAVLGGVFWLSLQEPEIPEVTVAATGAIHFDVNEGASIFLGGREVGNGPKLTLDGLSTGDYRIRLELKGHRPIEELVSVTRGGSTSLRRVLEPWGDAAPTLVFTSRPGGATVTLDGVELGVTPLTWTEGEPGRKYDVTITRAGYQPFEDVIEPLEEGAEHAVRARLRSDRAPQSTAGAGTADAAGKLRVVLMGATWANVWVDGKKLSRTAPFADYELSVGKHQVRVENSAIGMKHEQTVVVSPGSSHTVRALAN